MSPAGPVGYFLIDSLDSLLLTGLTDEYRRARDWVENLDFNLDDKFHTFEVSLVLAPFNLGKSVLTFADFANRSRFASSEGCSRRTTTLARTTGCSWTRPSTSPTACFQPSKRCACFPIESAISSSFRKAQRQTRVAFHVEDRRSRARCSCAQPSGLPMSFVNLAQRQGIPDPDNRGMTSVAEAGYVDSDSPYFSETQHLHPRTDVNRIALCLAPCRTLQVSRVPAHCSSCGLYRLYTPLYTLRNAAGSVALLLTFHTCLAARVQVPVAPDGQPHLPRQG